MKIAYPVDVHDRFDAVRGAMNEIGEVDLLVVGSDITTGGAFAGAERAIESWRPLAPHPLALPGKMDSPAVETLADLGVALDGRGYTFDDAGTVRLDF